MWEPPSSVHTVQILRSFTSEANVMAMERRTGISKNKTEQAYLPDIVVDSLHHTGFRLPDSRLKALGLTVTGHSRRSMTYSAIGVHLGHSLDEKMRLIKTVSGMIHNLVVCFERSNEQVGYDVEWEMVRRYRNRKGEICGKLTRYWAESLVTGRRTAQ